MQQLDIHPLHSKFRLQTSSYSPCSDRVPSVHLQQWKDHLTWEVERAMRRGVGLEHLPQERVAAALALTLVRGVCEQTPRLLRDLFSAVLQYFTPAGRR